MANLELTGISKTFADGTEAVRQIDLAVAKGQFVVLLGPSGCGKTTTLRMVAGLEVPTTGSIHLDGRPISPLDGSQPNVGFVFQFYALYPHMTVRQNIGFALKAMGLSGRSRRQRVGQMADALGLTPLLDRYPRQLSGGDQQRVALARAMVRQPDLWLMDEPLGTLDADQRLRMRQLIRSRQLELNLTTIYVTHDQQEAMALADTIAVMDGGRILQIGSPAEVYDQPANRFVAHFVGSPGMNFIDGHAAGCGNRSWLVTGDGQKLPLPRLVAPGQVTLGVRPEFFYPDPSGPLAGQVSVVQYMGSHRILHVDSAGCDLAVRLDLDHTCGPGDPIRLSFDPRHGCLFDAAGRSL